MLTQEQQEKLRRSFKVEKVEIPEAGGVVWVRQRDELRQSEYLRVNYSFQKDAEGKEVGTAIEDGFDARKIATAECDENLQYCYPVSASDQAAFDAAVLAIRQWPDDVRQRVLDAVNRVNPLPQSPEAAAKNS
jgi:hypothetical protein